jgi:hypothetical protein
VLSARLAAAPSSSRKKTVLGVQFLGRARATMPIRRDFSPKLMRSPPFRSQCFPPLRAGFAYPPAGSSVSCPMFACRPSDFQSEGCEFEPCRAHRVFSFSALKMLPLRFLDGEGCPTSWRARASLPRLRTRKRVNTRANRISFIRPQGMIRAAYRSAHRHGINSCQPKLPYRRPIAGEGSRS